MTKFIAPRSLEESEHTNMLIQRFRNCSQHVKIVIFRAYCFCLYGVALWTHFR